MTGSEKQISYASGLRDRKLVEIAQFEAEARKSIKPLDGLSDWWKAEESRLAMRVAINKESETRIEVCRIATAKLTSFTGYAGDMIDACKSFLSVGPGFQFNL